VVDGSQVVVAGTQVEVVAGTQVEVVVGKQVEVVVGKQVEAGTQGVVVVAGTQQEADVEDMQELNNVVQDTNSDSSLHRTEESSPRVQY